MVTSGLAVWKAAIHASWAEPCDDAPAPSMVPERSLAAGSSEPPSFAAHEDRRMVPAIARAPKVPKRLKFTVFPFTGLITGHGPVRPSYRNYAQALTTFVPGGERKVNKPRTPRGETGGGYAGLCVST